ncbi:helix-turn-helix domain-containing protein [Saprospiraceae bacterium]|nr:helix-turn-helix domain-containing protein [Saprospiraceae bacterium]
MTLDLIALNELPKKIDSLLLQIADLKKSLSSSKEEKPRKSRQESAIYLGVSKSMIDKLAQQGRLTRIKVGRKTVFCIKELNEILNNKR